MPLTLLSCANQLGQSNAHADVSNLDDRVVLLEKNADLRRDGILVDTLIDVTIFLDSNVSADSHDEVIHVGKNQLRISAIGDLDRCTGADIAPARSNDGAGCVIDGV